MQRINTPDKLFHDGDQSTGVQGTLVLAAWLNAVQEELAKTVEGLGLTLDPAQSNQLLTALLSSFVNVGGDVMTGNLTLPELRVGDANARIKRVGTAEAMENIAGDMVLSMLTSGNFAPNATFDGTNWNRIDTAQPASRVVVDRSGTLNFYTAASGANPIAWSGPYPVATALGALIQSGGDTIGLRLLRAAADNYQIRTNDNGAGAQQDATKPSWALAVGVGDKIIAYRRPPGGSYVQLCDIDSAGRLSIANAAAAAHAVTLGQFVTSLASNGYIKLPGGLIVQWGNVTLGDFASGAYAFTATVTYPIAFPNAVLHALCSKTNDATSVVTGSRSHTTTSMQVYAEEWAAATQGANANLSWLVMGY